MRLMGTILLIGLLLGWGLGGRLRNLADVRLRLWPAIPVAVLMQLAPVPDVGGELGRLLPMALVLVSYVVLVVVVVANWRLRGFRLILVGIVLNMVVIGVNQGMPVSAEAIQRSGNLGLLEDLPTERGRKHHLATDDDVLLFLSDHIAVRRPFGVVVSPGDVAVDLGAAVFLTAAMLARPERRRYEDQIEPAVTWGTAR